jgi:hypothetical protein
LPEFWVGVTRLVPPSPAPASPALDPEAELELLPLLPLLDPEPEPECEPEVLPEAELELLPLPPLLDPELEPPAVLELLEPEPLPLLDSEPVPGPLPYWEDPQFVARVRAAPVATSFATATARLMIYILFLQRGPRERIDSAHYGRLTPLTP